jgi:hypothetical protein
MGKCVSRFPGQLSAHSLRVATYAFALTLPWALQTLTMFSKNVKPVRVGKSGLLDRWMIRRLEFQGRVTKDEGQITGNVDDVRLEAGHLPPRTG